MALLYPAVFQPGDTDLDPVGAGNLHVYDNETTNDAAIYTDPALTIGASNPVVLDAAGRMTANIYVANSTSFTLTLKDSADTTEIWSRDDIWGTHDGLASSITYNLGVTGAVDRTSEARLQDWISIKDFGAVGDGVADDTAAIQAAIDYGIDNNRGITIYFPSGTYDISASITAPPDGADERRNMSFVGDGMAATDTGTVLNYIGTDVDGMFDLDSVQNFHFEKINFLNSASSINQLIRVQASDVTALSAWKITFEKCQFQNLAFTANELANGHVWLYNTLDVAFRDCKFFGSPINVTLGIDPALTSGIAAGGASRTTFDNTFFTGDVNVSRAELTNFVNGCVFAEKWDNSGFTDGARIYSKAETWSLSRGLNCIGIEFIGLFNPSTYTAGAINLEDSCTGVLVHGCTFHESYIQGVKVQLDCDGIDIVGNHVDMDTGTNSKFIVISSSFTGRLTQSNNHLTASMIADGGELFQDTRSAPYAWPYVSEVLASSDYTVLASNTWEKALTTAAGEWREGMYRIHAVAQIEGAGSHIVTMRVTNTDAYASRVQAEGSTISAERITLEIDDIVYINEAGSASETWSIEIRQAGATGAIMRALSGGGSIAASYINIQPM